MIKVNVTEGEVRIRFSGEHRTVSTDYPQVKGALRNAAASAADAFARELQARGFGARARVSGHEVDADLGFVSETTEHFEHAA